METYKIRDMIAYFYMVDSVDGDDGRVLRDLRLDDYYSIRYNEDENNYYIYSPNAYNGISLDMSTFSAKPFVSGLYTKDAYPEDVEVVYDQSTDITTLFAYLHEKDKFNKDLFYDIQQICEELARRGLNGEL